MRHDAIVFLAGLAALASPTISAAQGMAACWARSYDAAHMRAHPGQEITAIEVIFDGVGATGESWGGVRVAMNGAWFSESIFCQAPVGGVRACGVECDGGGFTLTTRDSDGSVLLTNSQDGFRVAAPEAGCSGDAPSVYITPELEHRLFRLFQCN